MFGNENKGLKRLIHSLEHGGTQSKLDIAFKAAPAHSMTDEMRQTHNLPDGYFLSGTAFTYKPMSVIGNILGQRSHDTYYNEDRTPVHIARKQSAIPAAKLMESLKATLQQFGVNDPNAMRATKQGVWISAAALQEMMKGRYLPYFRHSHDYTLVTAETPDGKDVDANDLKQRLTSTLKAQGISPAGIDISVSSVNGVNCTPFSAELEGLITHEIGVSAIAKTIRENVQASLTRNR